jgi:hypothetical protein
MLMCPANSALFDTALHYTQLPEYSLKKSVLNKDTGQPNRYKGRVNGRTFGLASLADLPIRPPSFVGGLTTIGVHSYLDRYDFMRLNRMADGCANRQTRDSTTLSSQTAEVKGQMIYYRNTLQEEEQNKP